MGPLTSFRWARARTTCSWVDQSSMWRSLLSARAVDLAETSSRASVPAPSLGLTTRRAAMGPVQSATSSARIVSVAAKWPSDTWSLRRAGSRATKASYLALCFSAKTARSFAAGHFVKEARLRVALKAKGRVAASGPPSSRRKVHGPSFGSTGARSSPLSSKGPPRASTVTTSVGDRNKASSRCSDTAWIRSRQSSSSSGSFPPPSVSRRRLATRAARYS
mmetsp:Transcript_28281/g.91186  ORF Transcript_28281/g.91186 Transcript_28281/m.91186 type:complete len:220 (+) Transcript_28281:406-1065(+)